MIARSNRFHGYNSLNHVYRQGKTIRLPQMTLKFGLSERRKTYRAAVVVSKKVNKSAVVRNRIRRRVYEVIRQNLPADSPPYDLVFSIYDEKIAELPPGDVEKIVKSLLGQAIKTN